MKKSTYYIITILLNTILLSFACQAGEDDVKTNDNSDFRVDPILLDELPYKEWPSNSKVIYDPVLSANQNHETILNIKDKRKKIVKLPLKILPKQEHFDIAKYVVKLYSYYGYIGKKSIVSEGTATMIRAEDDIIYFLTCAHNVVKYKSCSSKKNESYPKSDNTSYTKHCAKSISFYYKGREYPCKSYYVHPDYSVVAKNKDIAIVVSHRGKNLSFPYSFFPKIVSVAENNYKGYIIGFPGGKGYQEKTLYGMEGNLERTRHAIKYSKIDTSDGQSGSAIWAEVNGTYQIIGVHTIGREFLNCGPFLSKDMIVWEKLCWLKAQEIYHKNQNNINQIDIIKFLETPVLDINKKYKNGITLFLLAAKRGDLNALKKLKEKGANLRDTDHNGKNALDYAIQYTKNAELIEWLIDIGQFPVVLKKNNDQLKLLVSTFKYNNLSALKVLARKGVNLHSKDENGKNVLHHIVQYTMNVTIFNWFIDKAKIPLNAKSLWFYGETPFLVAAQQGNLTFLKALKEKGANVHATDKYGYNAIHFAIDKNVTYEVIDWLVNVAKVDINAKRRDHYQKTPFLCAAQKGNLRVLKLLKEKNVKLLITDKEGKNALHLAAIFSQNHKAIKWLIDIAKIPIEGTAPTRFHDDELPPFLWAAQYGNISALKALKQKGAKIYAKDKHDKDALWYAEKHSSSQETIHWIKKEFGLLEK